MKRGVGVDKNLWIWVGHIGIDGGRVGFHVAQNIPIFIVIRLILAGIIILGRDSFVGGEGVNLFLTPRRKPSSTDTRHPCEIC